MQSPDAIIAEIHIPAVRKGHGPEPLRAVLLIACCLVPAIIVVALVRDTAIESEFSDLQGPLSDWRGIAAASKRPDPITEIAPNE